MQFEARCTIYTSLSSNHPYIKYILHTLINFHCVVDEIKVLGCSVLHFELCFHLQMSRVVRLKNSLFVSALCSMSLEILLP